MHHFFVTPGQVAGEEIQIEGTDVNHIKNVLRMKLGEDIRISDGNNNTYICKLHSMEQQVVKAIILQQESCDTELSSKLYLFQGLPKSDKMEWIIQKAVELGVYEIVPVNTNRSVVKLDDKKTGKKVERWNTIAESAAKQSGRGIIPKVIKPMSFAQALTYAKTLDVRLIPYELAEGMQKTRQVLESIKAGQSVGIFIGPEGGFEVAEVEEAKRMEAKEITLGKRILRTETAGLTALSILMYHLEG